MHLAQMWSPVLTINLQIIIDLQIENSTSFESFLKRNNLCVGFLIKKKKMEH